jgi:hypothetical protein
MLQKSLEMKTAQLAQAHIDMKEKRDEVERLQVSLGSKEQELADAKRNLIEANTRVTVARESLDAMQTLLGDDDGGGNLLLAKMKELETVSAKAARCNELEAAVLAKSQEVDALHTEVTRLQEKLKEVDRELHELRSRVRLESLDAGAGLHEKDDRIKELTKKVDELEAALALASKQTHTQISSASASTASKEHGTERHESMAAPSSTAKAHPSPAAVPPISSTSRADLTPLQETLQKTIKELDAKTAHCAQLEAALREGKERELLAPDASRLLHSLRLAEQQLQEQAHKHEEAARAAARLRECEVRIAELEQALEDRPAAAEFEQRIADLERQNEQLLHTITRRSHSPAKGHAAAAAAAAATVAAAGSESPAGLHTAGRMDLSFVFQGVQYDTRKVLAQLRKLQAVVKSQVRGR